MDYFGRFYGTPKPAVGAIGFLHIFTPSEQPENTPIRSDKTGLPKMPKNQIS